MTTTIISIRICERTVTPLGETADTQWIANLQDAPIAELQKARDYIGREISMREAVTPVDDDMCPDVDELAEIGKRAMSQTAGEEWQIVGGPAWSKEAEIISGVSHEPFHLKPTPTAHKYTPEEFERMGFEPVRAHVVIDYGRFGSIYPFDAEETPQGFAFWECQYNAGQLSDEGRAALQDMIQQYEGLQHG